MPSQHSTFDDRIEERRVHTEQSTFIPGMVVGKSLFANHFDLMVTMEEESEKIPAKECI